MARYPLYVEIADDGRCMAHVLDLPGCIVRAPSLDEAMRQLPDAIRNHHLWLRRHGEPAPPDSESIEIEIAGKSVGFGPFDPGNAAALFPPDRETLTPEGMEAYFRLMSHARADLLALVRDLPDDVLDWQADPRSFSIRSLLRHVGNAEEWYVSRLVPPETLPPEWEHDKDLPIFEFLEMERRTARARLRQLTAHERSAVFYPTHWTDHPDEPWTARKALRRFLEHEREHTAQGRVILAAWRCQLLGSLAAERAELLWQLIGLEERALTESPVFDDWTAKNLLAHIAAWDELFTERIELILAGREEEIAGVEPDARNAVLHAERKDWSLKRAVKACVTARADALAALARLPDEQLHRLRSFRWGEASARLWTEWRARHDAAHAADLTAWRKAQSLERRTRPKSGPKAVLLATLAAARDELLAAAALVAPEERASRPVCGTWTLKDVLGHVADWELWFVKGLRQLVAGQPLDFEDVKDVEAWNRAHAKARRDLPWETVWDDFRETHEALMSILVAMSQADLKWAFMDMTVYDMSCIYVDHDREHARGLRDAIGAEHDEARDS
jgi:uncharacterized damage-inducible protein DinB/predicted RNase H-like HicB family nuclease